MDLFLMYWYFLMASGIERFKGEVIHSSQYKDCSVFEGRQRTLLPIPPLYISVQDLYNITLSLSLSPPPLS
jgi:hypothetical protein